MLTCLSIVHAEEERLPVAVSNEAKAIDSAISLGALGLFRVEVMAIDDDTRMDPPPKRSEFKSASDVAITVSFTYCVDYVKTALIRLRSVKWEKTSIPGFARWRFRIIGPWDRGYLDMLIDREGSLIEIDGVWYRVDRQTADLLTSGVFDLTSHSFSTKKSK